MRDAGMGTAGLSKKKKPRISRATRMKGLDKLANKGIEEGKSGQYFEKLRDQGWKPKSQRREEEGY